MKSNFSKLNLNTKKKEGIYFCYLVSETSEILSTKK